MLRLLFPRDSFATLESLSAEVAFVHVAYSFLERSYMVSIELLSVL